MKTAQETLQEIERQMEHLSKKIEAYKSIDLFQEAFEAYTRRQTLWELGEFIKGEE